MPKSTKITKTAISSFKYRYVLALGSNLGDLNGNCDKALRRLSDIGVVLQESRRLMTAALPYEDGRHLSQGVYLNLIVDFASNQAAPDLYQEIVTIEDALGHDRKQKGASRHIDIDILLWFYNQQESLMACEICNKPQSSLTIPHLELFNRDFLVELLERDFKVSALALKSKLQNAGKA